MFENGLDPGSHLITITNLIIFASSQSVLLTPCSFDSGVASSNEPLVMTWPRCGMHPGVSTVILKAAVLQTESLD